MTMRPFRLRSAITPIAALLLASACRSSAGAAASTADATTHEHATSAMAPAASPAVTDDGSVYDLAGSWRDQDGRATTLGELAGRPRVVAMIYTQCTHTCPLILGDLKRLEAALTPQERAGAGFVLVTLDPEHDTPQALAEFAHRSRLDPARWTLLTASPGDVRQLAAVLGVRYRAGQAGEIAHTNAITILDATGAVAYQQRGVGDGIEPVHHALSTQLARR